MNFINIQAVNLKNIEDYLSYLRTLQTENFKKLLPDILDTRLDNLINNANLFSI